MTQLACDNKLLAATCIFVLLGCAPCIDHPTTMQYNLMHKDNLDIEIQGDAIE